MQVGQFPAAAASSLIEGYCSDFIELASVLAQTLEQVSMRGIDIQRSRGDLERIESGMRELSEAIRDLVERGSVRSEPADSLAIGLPSSAAANANKVAATPITNSADWLPAAQTPEGGESEAATTPSYSERIAEEFGDELHEPVEDPLIAELRAQEDEHEGTDPETPDDPDALSEAETDAGLCGSNQSMPVRTVFQFLERVRKSGTLTVQLADELLTFEFDAGCVQSCGTDNPDKSDRLGDLLIDFESCDPDRLADLIRTSEGQSNLQLGERVVREGLAGNTEIMDALESQARRRYQRACDAAEAVYEFVEGRPRHTDGRVRITPMELSFETSWSPGV